MAFNGAGLFVRLYNWVQDRNNGIKILATRMDAEMDGFATGLSTCITKDGQTTVTANITMSNNKILLLASGTLVTDAANVGQLQTGASNYSSASGTNAYVAAMTPTLTSTALVDGFTANIYFPNANTSAATATLNIDGLGAKNLVSLTGGILSPNVVRPGPAMVIYYGTVFYYFPASAAPYIADGGTQTSGFTAVINTSYNCVFGANGTITGPAAASTGDKIPLSLAGPYIYFFAPNSLKINSQTATLPIPGNQSLTLTYTGATNGWV